MQQDPFIIRQRIRNALLGEVRTTPKPGLVDLRDNGAHTDMDVQSFERSTEAVTPFLVRMYEAGASFAKPAADEAFTKLFLRVRDTGREAERAMFAATGGVNTHKGMLFSMGLMVTAMGVHDAGTQPLPEHASLPYAEQICFLAKRIAGPVLEKELRADALSDKNRVNDLTHGERVLITYGVNGVRGEALAAFPVLREIALPRYRTMRDLKENDRALDTLLAVMAKLADTNVLSRGGKEALSFVQSRAADLLSSHTPGSARWHREIERFNGECIEKNISPGGAADTLALVLLLLS